jgi:serine/threonine protein kinase
MRVFSTADNTVYELGEELRRGGEGRTWKATQLGIRGRRFPVALKVLSHDYLGAHLEHVDVSEILLTWREQAEVLRHFAHRAFVPIQAVFTVSAPPDDASDDAVRELVGLPAVVTAWVDGKDLGEWSRGMDDPLRRLDVLADAAEALDAFHAQTGHIHRDLKPTNVIVPATGAARVIDFGLLRDTQLPRDSSVIKGSPGYLAPEILAGAPYTAGTDRFAFAGVLYHQLVRRPPPSQFVSRNPVATICEAVSDAGFPAAATLLGGLMQPEPSHRLEVAGAADMLDRVRTVGSRSVRSRGTPAPGTSTAPSTESFVEQPERGEFRELPGRAGTGTETPIRTGRALAIAGVVFTVVIALFAVLHTF